MPISNRLCKTRKKNKKKKTPSTVAATYYIRESCTGASPAAHNHKRPTSTYLASELFSCSFYVSAQPREVSLLTTCLTTALAASTYVISSRNKKKCSTAHSFTPFTRSTDDNCTKSFCYVTSSHAAALSPCNALLQRRTPRQRVLPGRGQTAKHTHACTHAHTHTYKKDGSTQHTVLRRRAGRRRRQRRRKKRKIVRLASETPSGLGAAKYTSIKITYHKKNIPPRSQRKKYPPTRASETSTKTIYPIIFTHQNTPTAVSSTLSGSEYHAVRKCKDQLGTPINYKYPFYFRTKRYADFH